MSLERLFTDRRARKYIKDSIYEAKEIKNDVCDKCGSNNDYLLEAFGKHLCEDCCNEILNEISEDYDTVYESSDNAYIWNCIISEGYTTGDYAKLTQDAANKNMPVHKYLKSEYGLTVPANLGDTYATDGRIYIPQKDIVSGNTKINRFIDDYNVQFTKAKTIIDLVPDADGYVAKIKGGASNGASMPTAPAPKVPSSVKSTTQSTIASNKPQKPTSSKGSGFTVTGVENHFIIKISSDISFDCTQTLSTSGANNYDVCIEGTNNVIAYTVKQGSIKDMAAEILSYVKETPCALFTAFDDEFDSADGYILSEYPSYSFMFDDDSFDGKNLSLVLAQDKTPLPRTRIALTKKDVLSKASLDGKLLRALQNRLSQFYPCLFDGTMNIKTSIGKAISTFVSVDSKGMVKIYTELGNARFDWEISGGDLKDKDLSVNSMLYAVYSGIEKIIPDWTRVKNKYATKPNPKYTDCFRVETTIDGNKVDVYLNFSLQELFDKHDFIFNMSVVDNNSGIEQPKEYLPVLYNKSGILLNDFAEYHGRKIYSKYFDKSTMSQTISASAQEKMKNRSKKAVFLSHVANVLKDFLTKTNKAFKNIDLDIEKFDVNADNKVTNVVFRVSDPFNDIAGNCDDLEKALDFKSVWVKELSKGNSPKELKEYGPSILYKVTDIEDFSNFINLPVLESAMLEAFGLERKGRKVIGINEAYFIEENGEFRLVLEDSAADNSKLFESQEVTIRDKNELDKICAGLTKYLNKKGIGYDELSVDRDKIFAIVDGDWKHDHLVFKNAVKDYLKSQKYKAVINDNPEDNGSDTYEAEYYITVAR